MFYLQRAEGISWARWNEIYCDRPRRNPC